MHYACPGGCPTPAALIGAVATRCSSRLHVHAQAATLPWASMLWRASGSAARCWAAALGPLPAMQLHVQATTHHHGTLCRQGGLVGVDALSGGRHCHADQEEQLEHPGDPCMQFKGAGHCFRTRHGGSPGRLERGQYNLAPVPAAARVLSYLRLPHAALPHQGRLTVQAHVGGAGHLATTQLQVGLRAGGQQLQNARGKRTCIQPVATRLLTACNPWQSAPRL